MPVNSKIVTDHREVRQRLSDLGLEVTELLDVVKHYALSIASQTEDHPTWGRGITPASETVFALRNRLKPKGWTREEVRGFALTVHPDGDLAINIAKGDEGTGNPETNVTSSSEKGICTEEAVGANQLMLDIPAPAIAHMGRPTWYLLVRKMADGVHSEFSLPVGLEEQHISLWVERLMLPVVGEDSWSDSTSGFEAQEIKVSVSRKQ